MAMKSFPVKFNFHLKEHTKYWSIIPQTHFQNDSLAYVMCSSMKIGAAAFTAAENSSLQINWERMWGVIWFVCMCVCLQKIKLKRDDRSQSIIICFYFEEHFPFRSLLPEYICVKYLVDLKRAAFDKDEHYRRW